MSLVITCTSCQASLKVKDEAAGKKMRCPRCKAIINVPAEPEVEEAVEVVEEEETASAAAPFDFDQPQECPKCHKQVPGDAVRCPHCKARLETAAEAPPTDKPKAKKKDKKEKEKIFCLPCPECGGREAKPVKWTFWGRRYWTKKFNHVRCEQCGFAYNGRTGDTNLIPALTIVSTTIILVVALIVGLVIGVIKSGVIDWLLHLVKLR